MQRRHRNRDPVLRVSMRAPSVLLAAAVVLLGLAATAHAELAKNTYSRLRAQSHFVFVGRVKRVLAVPVTRKPDKHILEFSELALAEVDVRTWLKGRSTHGSVWVLATSTDDEDYGQTSVGEQVVLFLDGRGVADLVDAQSAARVSRAIGGREVHRIAWFGRGRMPIEVIEGEPFATLFMSNLYLPSDLDTIPGPDPRYRDFIRRVRVSDLAAFVRDGAVAAVPGLPTEVRQALEGWDGPFDRRASAYAAMAALDKRSLPHLRRVLEAERSPLRENAAMAIACMDAFGREALTRWLRSEDPGVRRAAAFAVEFIAWSESIWDGAFEQVLLDALRDKDPMVRSRILRSFAVASSSEEELIRARLPAALRSEDRSERIDAARLAGPLAPWYLGYGDGPDAAAAREALRSRARSQDVWERRAVWEALSGCAGPAEREAAVAAMKDADRVVRCLAAAAFARASGESDAPHVKTLLTHGDAWIRRAAAFGLMARGNPAYIEALVGRLRDEDEITRNLAVEALGALGPRAASAVPALRKARDAAPESRLAVTIDEALESIQQR